MHLSACFQSNQILMSFPGNVENEPKNRWLNSDDVLVEFDLWSSEDLWPSFFLLQFDGKQMNYYWNYYLFLCCSASQTYSSVKVRWGESRQWIWNTHARRKKRKPTDGWNERSSCECHCMALTRRAPIVSVQTVQPTKIHHYFVFCQLNISCPTDWSCAPLLLFSFSICPFTRGEATFGLGLFFRSRGSSCRPKTCTATLEIDPRHWSVTSGGPVREHLFPQKLHPFIWHTSNHSGTSMTPAKCSELDTKWLIPFFLFPFIAALSGICESLLERLCAQSSHFWQTLLL